MRFMQSDTGDPVRTECYICPPKLKLDGERRRVMTLIFSVKLDANGANTCDEKIRRAFEDVTFLEREIQSVTLNSEVENTDIDFFELPADKAPHKQPALQVRNGSLVGLYVERLKGETYLYFQFEVNLSEFGSIGHFFQARFGTVIFGEFRASQFALQAPRSAVSAVMDRLKLGGDLEELKANPEILQIWAKMVKPLLVGDETSFTLEFEGESIKIDRDKAALIVEAAKAAKKLAKNQ